MAVGYDFEFRRALEEQDRQEAFRRQAHEEVRQAGREADEEDETPRCSNCGSTETIELFSEGGVGHEFSVTVCAECGAD